tara:strand:- start:419 stop:592 length:174 start_codon:yes stop_codon:yes gene_type:complete
MNKYQKTYSDLKELKDYKEAVDWAGVTEYHKKDNSFYVVFLSMFLTLVGGYLLNYFV